MQKLANELLLLLIKCFNADAHCSSSMHTGVSNGADSADCLAQLNHTCMGPNLHTTSKAERPKHVWMI